MYKTQKTLQGKKQTVVLKYVRSNA